MTFYVNSPVKQVMISLFPNNTAEEVEGGLHIDSMTLVQIIARVEELYGVKVPISIALRLIRTDIAIETLESHFNEQP